MLGAHFLNRGDDGSLSLPIRPNVVNRPEMDSSRIPCRTKNADPALSTVKRRMTEVWLVAAILALPACTIQTGQEDAANSASTGSASTTVAAASVETVATPTSEGEVVRGWPHTQENPAGVYSWDLSSCAGASCTMGFMHNGYGSGDVDILFREAVSRDLDDEGTPVTVAGYDGFYQSTGVGREEWLVNIEGKRVGIRLVAAPGTSQADLDEAHAIIESIRTESIDNRLGFRLVFTLSTNDWDSG